MSRTLEDKKKIREANALLAARGKKSRYIDDAPTEDWNLSELADDDQLSPMADVPLADIAASQGAKERVLEEMKKRGLLDDSYHAAGSPPPPETRRQAVVKLLAQMKQLGWGYEKYEAELKEIDSEVQ